MKIKNSFRYILLVMLFVAVAVTSIALYMVNKTAIKDNQIALTELLNNRVASIKTLFQNAYTKDSIIDYFYDWRLNYPDIGNSNEFVITEERNDSIYFLVDRRGTQSIDRKPVFANSNIAAPSARANAGLSGYMEGVDYRGVKVYAAYTYIPELKWGVVSKIDVSEVQKPLIHNFIIILILSIIASFLGAILYYWINKSITKTAIASELRYRRLFEAARDGILILDAETGMIVDVNPYMIEMLGFPYEAFIKKTIWEIGFFKDILANKDNFLELQQKGYVRYEDLPLETAYGKVLDVEFISNSYMADNIKVIQCNIRNITDRVKAEKLKHESEYFFKETQKAATIGSYKTDFIKGRWESSEVLDTIFGIDKDYDRSVSGWLDIIHPDDNEMMNSYLIEEVIAKRNDFDKEYRIVRNNDNQTRWVLGLGKVSFDDNGNIITMIGTIQDISERKLIEEALIISETRYKVLVRDMQVGLLIQGSKAEILLSNNKAFELLGLTEDQLLGKTSFDPDWNVIHEDGSPFPGSTHPVPQAIETRKSVANVIMGVYQPTTGNRVWLLVCAEPQLNQSGEVEQVVCSFVEITKRKQAELKLKESEEKYRLLFENMVNGFAIHEIILNDNGEPCDYRFLELNQAFEKLTGLTNKDVVGKTCMEVMPETEQYWIDTYGKVALTGKGIEFENYSKELNRHFHVDAYSPEPGKFATVFADITERKLLEEQLIMSNKALVRSNQELEQFAYVATHDLQEPLRMVASFTQLLEKKYKDKLDADANEFIRYAVDGALRMQKLINDLLDYSRVNTQEKVFQQVDSSTIIGQVISGLQLLIIENTALITNDDLPVINAIDSQMVQIFQNLIENAIKFKKKNEIPKIQISCIKKENVFEFSVKDNGIGIDMQFHERVFLIFQRLHSVRDYPGTGIGLSLCKRIIERHGGTIWFESILDEGTTFYFTIAI